MCLENPSSANNLSSSYGQDIQAQIKYAPQEYASNAQYSPLYTQMDLSNLDSFLNGSNGQSGYLSEYVNQIAPAAATATANSNSTIRQRNMNDLQNLLPSMTAATRSANPQGAGLLDTLSSNASRDLSYGTQLTPAEQVQFNQTTRQGQAARGGGFSPSDVFNESLDESGYGQNLYQQRQGQASSVASQTQGFYGNDINDILGTSANMSTANSLSSTGTGASGSAGAQTGNEFSANSSLIGNQMNENYSASEAGAANNNAGINMGVSAASGAVGALGKL